MSRYHCEPINWSSDQLVTSDVSHAHEYPAKIGWTCRKCGRRFQTRYTCRCGEINAQLRKIVFEKRRAKRLASLGIAPKPAWSVADYLLRKHALNKVRKTLTSRSNKDGTCERDGCTVPYHMLYVLHNDSSRQTQLPSLRKLEEIQSLIDNNTDMDGNIHLKALCPLHQAELVHQRSKNRTADQTAIQTTHQSTKLTLTELRQNQIPDAKIARRHCDHDRCFHPNIPECTRDNHHLFVLAHIVNQRVATDLNLAAAAHPVMPISYAAHTLSAPLLTQELEKCRLMHATCSRDHRRRFTGLTFDQKKSWLRNYLSTHDVAEWFRQSVLQSLDQHDAMQDESDQTHLT